MDADAWVSGQCRRWPATCVGLALNKDALDSLPPRAGTRTRWVTEVSNDAEGDGNFGGGVTVELVRLMATSQLPHRAGAGKMLSIAISGRPLSASTQSAKNHERSRSRASHGSRSFSKALEPWRTALRNEVPSLGHCGSGISSRRHVGATRGGGKRGVADEIAEHPENIGCLGAVVSGGDGLGERLAGAFAGAWRLDQCQRGAARFERLESLLTATLFFNPQRSHEMSDAFIKPGAAAGFRVSATKRA